jgi:hypothetical protein
VTTSTKARRGPSVYERILKGCVYADAEPRRGRRYPVIVSAEALAAVGRVTDNWLDRSLASERVRRRMSSWIHARRPELGALPSRVVVHLKSARAPEVRASGGRRQIVVGALWLARHCTDEARATRPRKRGPSVWEWLRNPAL